MHIALWFIELYVCTLHFTFDRIHSTFEKFILELDDCSYSVESIVIYGIDGTF